MSVNYPEINLYHTNMKKLYNHLKWRFIDRQTILTMAFSYALAHKKVDINQFEQVSQKIKKRAGFFTTLQRVQRYILTTQLIANYDDPIQKVDQLFSAYHSLVHSAFKKETSTYFTALLLLDEDEAEINAQIDKALELYQKHKKEHPILVDRSIYPYVLLLARNDNSVEAILEEVENHYQTLLEQGFKMSIETFWTSQLLALSGDRVSTSDVVKLFQMMKERGWKVKPELYPSLALLSLSRHDQDVINEIENRINALNERIEWRKQKSLSKSFAIQLFLNEQSEGSNLNYEVLRLSRQLVQAQQIAVIAALTASTVASNQSSSNS
ncbi:Protein of unknown function [Pelagirhabdus alkalitolerans]|uniref:DUF4003 domain-containing protein n=1 Tax=Pelagirhabdus alkalitolerans TaxID=1612202 RepID=A0A1G6KNF5_9BACI|nr:DUF4003 family protein [Pelagirhabdus alkalitolerans]SDC32514.1 Protein of unknown function [Pelagirhabdus alkalitolerans]